MSYHNLLGMWLPIHAGIEVKHNNMLVKRAPGAECLLNQMINENVTVTRVDNSGVKCSLCLGKRIHR